MNEHNLFQIIGQTDDAHLLECDGPGEKHRVHPIRKTLLIAAMVAMLAISAVATPAIYSAMTNGTIQPSYEQYPYVSIYGPGAEGMTDGYEVLLNIEVSETAPKKLETPHIPAALLNETVSRCEWAEYGFVFWCRKGQFRFEQYAIPEDGNGTYRAIVRSIQDAKVRSTMTTYAGISVMEVIFDGFWDDNRQLYWSDGDYIYYLMLPMDADANALLATMTVMENVSDYLNEPMDFPFSPLPTEP